MHMVRFQICEIPTPTSVVIPPSLVSVLNIFVLVRLGLILIVLFGLFGLTNCTETLTVFSARSMKKLRLFVDYHHHYHSALNSTASLIDHCLFYRKVNI